MKDTLQDMYDRGEISGEFMAFVESDGFFPGTSKFASNILLCFLGGGILFIVKCLI